MRSSLNPVAPNQAGLEEDAGASCGEDEAALVVPTQAGPDKGIGASCGGNQVVAGERMLALEVGVREEVPPIVLSLRKKEEQP